MTRHGPFLILLSALFTSAGVALAQEQAQRVEISGRVSLGNAEGTPLAGVVLSAGGESTVTTDDKGRFDKWQVVAPKEGWVQLEARKEGYGVVNALDLRRPWPSALGRSFQVVMAPEAEVSDRAVLHWRALLLQRIKRSQPKSGGEADEKSPQVASYDEWLAAVPMEEPSHAWFRALNLLMAGKPGEAVKTLGPVEEPEEKRRRQHLKVISALVMGDEKAARKELEAAAAGDAPDAWAQLTLGRLLMESGEADAAQQTLQALAAREDAGFSLRARAGLGLAELRRQAGELAETARLFARVNAQFEEAARSGALSFADEARWASLTGNRVVAALQVEKLPDKARQLLDPMMKRHRALLARLPDAHDAAFVEALEFAGNVRTVLNDHAEAETLIRERVAFHNERTKVKPGVHLAQKARALESLGDLALLQNDPDGAGTHYGAAVEIVMGLSQPRESEGHLPLICGLLRKQGALLLKAGKAGEAKAAFQQGVSLHQELNRVRPDHVPHMTERALCLQNLGNACMALDESFAAAQAYLAAGQLNNRLVENGVEAQRARAFVCLKNVSAITQKTGHTKESMSHALEALKHAERIEADHPEQHADLAEVSMLCGLWILKEGSKAEAKPHLERTVRLYRQLAKGDLTGYAVRLGLALCAEAQMVEGRLAADLLAEAEALLTRNPEDAQAELLRQTLRLARKERGEVNL